MSFFARWLTYLQALSGNSESQYQIGLMLLNNDNEDARKSGVVWLDRASAQMHPDACMKLATYFISRNDIDVAIEYLKEAPLTDSREHQALLGQLYLTKYTDIIDFQRMIQPKKKDEEKKSATDELDEYVTSLYGSSLPTHEKPYLNSSDEQRDEYLSQALHYLQLAQEKEHPLALHSKSIYTLEYTKPDKSKQGFAVSQIKKAAEKGFAPSMQVLAGFYENGAYGLSRNIEIGLNWRIKAAETGSAEAQYTLGYLVYRGTGFKRHSAKGLELIQKAANKGHTAAIDFLKNINSMSN